ncbi:MAG: proline--tRNA ligase [Spirochaetaceae bacterium]|nr:proline--tRNA ligase [Spirochaetaceae bacterium]
MKISETMIPTLREVPAEAVIASHQLMLRAGIMRKLGNGLFAYLPFGLRAFRKVENIIREEMDNIGAMEFKQPVVVPGDIWKESGRWETMGPGMLKAVNRVDQELVVSPTAEEAFTAIIRDELSSYKQLPIVAYQINTKYRDEIRPRYGVMRGREFTMKDAYSFHTTQESLDETYEKFAKAYRKIFKRLGLSVIPVRADSGAMGGSGSEEFMVESVIGDDTLILCPKCGYAANTEKAACAPDTPKTIDGAPQKATDKPYSEIATPNVKTIEQLTDFLKTTPQSFIKTLIYHVVNSELDLTNAPGCAKLKRVTENGGANPYYPDSFFAVCIRGDLDVNEAKLAALLKASEVELASDADVERITGAAVGFAGPVKLATVPVVADETVMAMHDCITGGLKTDVHFEHVEPNRDFTPYITADVRTVVAGDICPHCGAEFYSKKGNELGHIFKLGYKYTKTMNVTYLDENGKQQIPTMGCYGIGVDRALASIIEEHHDDNGIIWPMSVAPYQVAIVPVKFEGAMKDNALAIYEKLQKAGIEVLLDDRSERPGVKFKDIDLLGIPVRIVVGDKNLPNVELKCRNSSEMQLVPATEAAEKAVEIVRAELAKLNG